MRTCLRWRLRIPLGLHWQPETGDSAIAHQQITLSSGRRLGFEEFGACTGRLLFYFHGFPGSRLKAKLIEAEARELGIRVIGIDRPGYGESDPQPEQRLVDWPADVRALAEALDMTRFGVLGVSGGGPYALACAAHELAGLERATVVCGVGPLCTFAQTLGMPVPRRIACAVAQVAPWLALLFVQI